MSVLKKNKVEEENNKRKRGYFRTCGFERVFWDLK